MLYSKQRYAFLMVAPCGSRRKPVSDCSHETPFFFFNYFLIKIFYGFKGALLLAFGRFFQNFLIIISNFACKVHYYWLFLFPKLFNLTLPYFLKLVKGGSLTNPLIVDICSILCYNRNSRIRTTWKAFFVLLKKNKNIFYFF